jgi:hypothetical protein
VFARSLVIATLVLVDMLSSATPSVACSCQYGPTDRAALAKMADVVFTGIARAYGEDRLGSTAIEFQVVSVYKGAVAPRMRVQALGGRGVSELGAGCGWGFQLSRHYTVFAIDHDSDGVPNTNGCLWPVDGPITASTYGLPAGRAPAVDSERQLAVVAVIALAVLAAISIARRPQALTP